MNREGEYRYRIAYFINEGAKFENEGNIKSKWENYSNAIQEIEENYRQEQKPEVLSLIGSFLHKDLKHESAKTFFLAAIREKPDYFPAIIELGYIGQLQRIGAKVQEYCKIATERSSNPEEWLEYEKILKATGRHKEAKITLQHAKNEMQAEKIPSPSSSTSSLSSIGYASQKEWTPKKWGNWADTVTGDNPFGMPLEKLKQISSR